MPEEERPEVEKSVDEEKEEQNKRAEEFIAELSAEEQRRVFALQGIQKKHNEIHKEYRQEMTELSKKYAKLFQPFFDQRKDIVLGKVEPTKEQIEANAKIVEVEDVENEDEKKESEAKKEEAEKEKDGDEQQKGVPRFWLTALTNNEYMEIQPHDEAALEFLEDISCDLLEGDEHGFRLDFHFSAENTFFSNTVLTKKYIQEDDEEELLDHAEGTKIDWKAGQNLTKVTKKKTQRKGKQTRTVTKTEDRESWFNFFQPPQLPSTKEQQQMDDDELDELEEMMQADYTQGLTLKDKIIPKAVDWFTGDAVPSFKLTPEMMANFMGGMDDDEEEEEDEVPVRKGKGKKKGGGAAGGGAAENPECKQQ